MPSLPADVTNNIPEFAMALANGARATLAWDLGTRRPYELLEMTTPNDLAYAIACIASDVSPHPGCAGSMNFRAMILTFGATPTTPWPSSDAAIVPAT